jgi:hypothetical protein
MRVLNLRESETKIQPHERFFVELWYGMTHKETLDSHRVRCLNSRTILRELNEELAILQYRSDHGLTADALKGLCSEALELLQQDPVIRKHFAKHFRILEPLLKTHPSFEEKGKGKKEEKSEPSSDEAKKAFRFRVADLNAALDRQYFEEVCTELQLAMKPGNEHEIHLLTGSLLTDLVDRGWRLEALFRWHKHFLLPRERSFSFAENLVFMLRQFAQPAQFFNVSLKLTGSKRLHQLGKLGPFELSQKPTIKHATAEEERFCRTDALVTFAQTKIEAFDHISAAIRAREKFEECLDLLRFNFEQAVLKIEGVSFVRRSGDGRIELPLVHHVVPNPVQNLSRDNFQGFVDGVNSILSRKDIDETSRERLAAAIRHYRFGRDADGYRDKSLNWWMGLELLGDVARRESGIGPTVIHNASHALVQPYLFRLLRDILATLKYCEIEWPPELAAAAGCDTLEELDCPKLLTLLQNPSGSTTLWQRCSEHPVVVFRGRKLADALSTPSTALGLLKLHYSHVLWQIGRVYRIRCCIVHGSPIRFRLALLAANLEFYLKEVILFVIDSFQHHRHITTLEEVYGRAELNFSGVVSMLQAANAPADTVRLAVFNSIVIQEEPPTIAAVPGAATPTAAPAGTTRVDHAEPLAPTTPGTSPAEPKP